MSDEEALRLEPDRVREFHDAGVIERISAIREMAEGEIIERSRITLIGLEHLFSLWVEHYDAIDKALLPLQPVHFFAPRD